MKVKAIIFGATGMVGEGVLYTALNHVDVESILVIGRNPCGIQHRKLRELLHSDFFDYSTIEEHLTGYNACYFCLGISSIGMSENEYRHITYDLAMVAAQTLSRLNPAMTFCYVSGLGTDSTEQGRSKWARVKGKTENDLRKLPFKATYLFRPGFIKPIKGLRRTFAMARILGAAYPFWHAIIPNYVCTLEDLGLAMISVAMTGYRSSVLECSDIAKAAESIQQHP